MIISNMSFIIFIISILSMAAFIVTISGTRQILAVHKCYFGASIILIIWLLALIMIKFTNLNHTQLIYRLDCITTTCAALVPLCSLMFAFYYTKEREGKMRRRYWLLALIPTLTGIVVWTNPLHHLYYQVFSLENDKVQFGPYFYVHSAYTFACVALSVFIIFRYALKTKTKLHIQQAILFTIGSLVPSVTNLLVLGRLIKATVSLTAISFVITLIFHGIIIYRLHFLDIKPVAMQQLVNWMSDCYLVINENGLVVNFNQSFIKLLGEEHRIRENVLLQSVVQTEDVENKTALYNLMTGIRSCQGTHTRVTYEQAFNISKNSERVKCYYMVEITPLVIEGIVCGFLSIFKDITQIKTNMQRLQDSQLKLMEQERLAFLGQMVGGIAHNLKTPIMSISGGIASIENLIEECRVSLNDPEVTVEDYREIYGEMDDWMQRIRDACAYMSDIIDAVKGQASNMNTTENTEFSLADTFKRVSLLLRHELLDRQCVLEVEDVHPDKIFLLNGDINNLVQVINNLVSNAIEAQVEGGNHKIIAKADYDEDVLKITIKDFGSGIPPKILSSLLVQMVTSKGTMGTGLGVFISNTVIRAKFGGNMWYEENPEGGTISGISIPLVNVNIIDREGEEER